ncbi:hypothetical protein ACIBQ1_09705 [Nonomuraea sp. NPDC050153]|uniref:hypothetical protein n=1 Tax=Nonomuraea sp. NPDC050153 TaxID=3364359 RepID=UPI0037A38CD4
MPRILWRNAPYSSVNGYVGGMCLFTIDWKIRREDPNHTLRTKLPGLDTQALQDDDANVLKRRAEQVLEEFVHKLGAVFPDSSTEED